MGILRVSYTFPAQLKFTFPASLFFRPLLILSLNYVTFTKVKRWHKPSNAILVTGHHPFSGCSETVSPDLAKSHPCHSIPEYLTGHSDKMGKETEAWDQEMVVGQDLTSSESYTRWTSTQKTTLALSRGSFALPEDIMNNLELYQREEKLKLREHWLRTLV